MARLRAALMAAAVAAATLTGCASDTRDTDPNTLTVWSLENLSPRVQATQRNVERFTARTGIRVKLVAVDENQLSQLITTAAAAGRLPDVVGSVPLTAVHQMASNELLDTATTAAVLRELGPETFSARALELTKRDGAQLAIPSDGWTQLLVYRKDLFARAGLPAPDTFENIERAARTLHSPQHAGITMATVPDDSFTAQTFESLALANGCDLVRPGGDVDLDSPSCVDTFRFYSELVRKYSVPGAQDVDTTRATYFAGKATMVVWSSFLLDELAGLRDDALPACPQCQADPTFLARNSGIITALRGPNGREPVQFGELTSWVVTTGSKTEAARRFLDYMFNEGYQDWFGMAPEGKFPARKGDRTSPERFVTAWYARPAGVDRKRPLGEVYSPDVLRAISTGPDTLRRWGISEGQGSLVGATLAELPVPKALNSLANGDMDPGKAAEQVADDVRAIQRSMS